MGLLAETWKFGPDNNGTWAVFWVFKILVSTTLADITREPLGKPSTGMYLEPRAKCLI